MEAKAALPHRTIRAFTGREYVSYEWRPVPADEEDNARSLQDRGYLVLKQNILAAPEPAVVSGYQSMTVAQLRDEAKALGVPYSGLKKSELIEALEDYDEEE